MKDKTTLFIRLKYELVMGILGTLTVLAFIFVGIFVWGIKDLENLFVLFFFFAIAIIVFIGLVLYSYQTATLSGNGIIIKSPVRKYCELKWEDIKAVFVKFKPTMSNSMGIWWKHNWVFISTQNDTVDIERFRETRNRKGKSPYVMLYRPKQAKTLAGYLQKYRPDIDLSELVKEYSTKSKAKWGHWQNRE